jgi:hypothetical protein
MIDDVLVEYPYLEREDVFESLFVCCMEGGRKRTCAGM